MEEGEDEEWTRRGRIFYILFSHHYDPRTAPQNMNREQDMDGEGRKEEEDDEDDQKKALDYQIRLG